MKYKKLQTNTGAAMMIFVIFLLLGSLTVIIGIVTPTIREFAIAKDSFDSKQTYFLSESGVEDAFYRIKNSKQISASETLVLGTSSTTTTITDVGSNQKEIVSLGDTNSHQRKVDLVVNTATGTSFNYGAQIGEGGLYLDSGTVNGNIYSNGPITASSSGSNSITGTAISANSPSVTSDQSNGSGTPSYDVKFADTSNTQDIAESFTISSNNYINKIRLYIKKTSTPSNATVTIRTNSSGSPSTTVLTTGTLSASAVGTSYGWVDVSFSSNYLLTAGTTYWIVVDTNASSTKYYTIGANANGYANGVGKIGQAGSSWNATTPSGLDYYFNIYTGGIDGNISGYNVNNKLSVGGNIKAHTVSYASTSGTIYCQVGTSNNKSCDTSSADPSYIPLPISESNITTWKDAAAAGGTYSGNYSVSGSNTASLGPKKINGNLSVSGSGILTLTGPLWVTGTVSVSGSGKIKLASGYGSDDEIIMSEGNVTVSGSGAANGSGASGSYIVIATTSTSSSAVTLSGSAGAIVLYAPYGGVTISGSAALKAVVGYSVSISGSGSITYESGLADISFSSGPSGSYSISSWKETQ